MNLKRIIIGVAVACTVGIIAFGCVKGPELDPSTKAQREALSAEENYGIYIDDKAVLEYNPERHQLYTASGNRTMRIMANDGQSYIEFALDSKPVKGEFIDARMKVVGNFVNGLSTSRVQLYVLEKKSSRCWVWCDDKKFGGIMWIK